MVTQVENTMIVIFQMEAQNVHIVTACIIFIKTLKGYIIKSAIHNFKLVKTTHICLISDQIFANLDVETLISFPITVI